MAILALLELFLREPEVELLELGDDFVDRLLSEVADLEEVLFGLLNQVADRLHALALQAVVGANGEIELLDRLCQGPRLLLFGLLRSDYQAARPLANPGKELEQLDERRARRRERF